MIGSVLSFFNKFKAKRSVIKSKLHLCKGEAENMNFLIGQSKIEIINPWNEN